MKNKIRNFLILLGSIASIAVIYNALSTNDDPAANTPDNEALIEEPQPVWVEVAEAVMGDIVTNISETGVTAPLYSVVVAAETSGRIVKMDIEVGDFVQQGDTIAVVDDELARLAIEQINAQLINATATYEKAQKDLERYRILLDNEEISESEYETIRVQRELALSTLLSTEAAAKSARRQLRDTRITSPISGQIAEKNVQEGVMISINQPVVKVVDIRTIKVNIQVSEQDIVSIRKNMSAVIRADSYPGSIFKGTVFTLSPEAHRESHTFPVEILVPNDQGAMLKSGVVVRVTIQRDVLRDVTLIPRDAIVERFGKTVVYVAAGQRAEEREVILGREKGEDVQIVSGVSPGEQVVVVGQFNLENGAPVRIKQD